MPLPSIPADVAHVAREAIKRLTSERLPLTPENYAQAYAQVSGIAPVSPDAQPPPASSESKSEDRLAALAELFTLLLDNLGELTPESGAMQGQIEAIKQLFTRPLDERGLTEARRQVQAMIVKQGIIKHGLDEARAVLKQMLATLIDRLGAMSDVTGEYHTKVESYVEKIKATDDLSKISAIVQELLSDTRGVSVNILQVRDELAETRQRVQVHEQHIHELENELVEVSKLVRTDPLTAALNRRGLEEVSTVELARAQRTATELTVALIDLDDFKRLNDAKGHKAGDEALVHVVNVIKELTRPTDAVGRYGGDEFVVLFPDTPVAKAAEVTTRIQRSLAKRFFLYNDEHLFIRFSAGVASVDPARGLADALERADKAVYEAKSLGKNKVMLGK